MKNSDWNDLKQRFIEGDPDQTLKDFAETVNVPYDLIRRQSGRDSWIAARDRFQSRLAAARDGRRARALSRDLAKLDDEIVGASTYLINQISSQLRRGEELRSSDCENYAHAIRTIQEVTRASRGNMGDALVTLVNSGVISPTLVPYILNAYSDAEIKVREKIEGILKIGAP